MGIDTINPHEQIAASEAKIVEYDEVPKTKIPEIINDLEWYLEYRKLEDLVKQYPGDSGYVGEATDKMLENHDLFSTLHEQYGWTPEDSTPKWSIDELEKLVEKLKNKI